MSLWLRVHLNICTLLQPCDSHANLLAFIEMQMNPKDITEYRILVHPEKKTCRELPSSINCSCGGIFCCANGCVS